MGIRDWYESARFVMPTYLLTLTAHFHVPLFTFSRGDGPEEFGNPIYDLVDLVQPTMIQTFCFEYNDSEESIFGFVYLKKILQHHLEFARGASAATHDSFIDEQQLWCTVLADFRFTLDEKQSGHYLQLCIDAYQDHFPTISEMCYLLALEENS